jgi:hypothetical protein
MTCGIKFFAKKKLEKKSSTFLPQHIQDFASKNIMYAKPIYISLSIFWLN